MGVSSSSGKSYFLSQKIIIDNLNGVNWLVCRQVGATIRKSVFNEIIKAIGKMGLTRYYTVNKSDMVITNNLNNKQIMFTGLDDVEKVKSTTPINGVLERIFIEEATEIKREAYLQLKKRLRGKTKVKKCIVFAFNPILKSHWIYKMFFEGHWKNSDTHYEDENISILKTTYKDNIFLSDDDRKMLEDETDPYFYNVYTLGNFGTLAGVVYKKVQEKVFDVAAVAKMQNVRSIFGLDFGYTNDPTALFCGLVDSQNKTIYVFDELYERGLVNAEIAERIKSMGYAKEKIIADCAEPKSIEELYRCGIPRIEGAQKGAILHGIQKIMRYTIIVHPKCVNFMREVSNYAWQTDKQGEPINKPTETDNHCLTGDTIIHTLNGDIPIKNLVGNTGELICYDENKGEKTISKFFDVRLTQKDAVIYEIETQDGNTIKATAEHPILTKKGWKKVSELTTEDEILNILK